MDNDENEQLLKNVSELESEVQESIPETETLNLNGKLSSLSSLQDFMCNGQRVTIPTTLLQSVADMQKAFYLTITNPMRETLDSISRMYIDVDRSSIISEISNIFQNSELQKSLRKITESYNYSVSQLLQSSILQWFKSFDFTPIAEALRKIADIDFDKLKEVYLQEMYDAHWFPYVSWNADFDLSLKIIDIIAETRKSKNRINKIDKAVFAYYTKDRIEETKKRWRTLGMPEHQMRILHQAVKAYHRREYALTVIVLTTQWEGIIYRKAHDNGRKDTKKTKKYLSALAEQNDYLEIFKSYYDEFIMYNCNSSAETIDDVPGRHSAAHNFYEKYPSRKAALNAILFADFLLNLKPLEEE